MLPSLPARLSGTRHMFMKAALEPENTCLYTARVCPGESGREIGAVKVSFRVRRLRGQHARRLGRSASQEFL